MHKRLYGMTLNPILANPEVPWDHPANTIWSENGRTLTCVSVRTERWHHGEFFDRSSGAMLLDPQNDLHEMKNLVSDPRYNNTVKDLSELVKKYVEGLTTPVSLP